LVEQYNAFEHIPSAFWTTPVVTHLPSTPSLRRSILIPILQPFFPSGL
jgi:hypothetical protein